MPELELRLATGDDARLLAELGARLFEQTFGAANRPADMQAYLAEAFTLQRQTAELQEPNRLTWIAENEEGVAVGYTVLIRGESTESIDANRPAELRRIYVDRSLHGRAIQGGVSAGALLVERCVSQARAWSCDVIWLAVWEKNPRALRFYEKHGFRRVGRQTFQLGEDLQHDFVMARNL